MNSTITSLDKYQYILNELAKDGDDLTIAREVIWTHSFLEKRFLVAFREEVNRRYPQISLSLQELQCESTLTLIPSASLLATIDDALDAISMKVANRTESHFSIPSAVPIEKYRT